MIYRLIIKGSTEEARAAAYSRGIILMNAWEHLPNETHAYAQCTDPIGLAAWLGEPPVQAPFPIGALLHYTDGVAGGKR